MDEQWKRYALITGCTPGGIGHYLALEFAANGYHVLATVRSPSKYTPPNDNITYLPLELPHEDSISSLHDRVASITGGRLDVLYNNAGRNYTVAATDIDMGEVQATFDANVFSVMRLCQIFTPMLIEAKGTIVQTGSLAGVMPYVFASVYAASKAALHAYSDTLRVELAPLGVRVITIVTGGVKSNIARTHRELPSDSYYMPIADQYEKRLTLSQQMGMDTQQYARSCVRHVIGGESWFGAVTKRWVWEGKMSWVVWFGWSYLPRGVLDWYFKSKFQLGRLRGTVGPDKKRV
ncbi:NADPH-dependent 1-acyl dihydroxyacetone phosphate reductase [Didymosphaeria variabile]|uniref:NADPH-dependent 1-acyl dihydroxyacetone phosphate reductase n=1 Tax=Didymosphaeria variabile TaxID=1932322 RepID=A0A9W8XPH0_9PLEO|nr:NADPH-dependent 1-acyl dihydroxyacetone phosphate reductase [Didymosphaeria variabile]KAJ4355927.1 NADPH-dependent 1-acyl dihydroxyacetone phosphate reductase [Didymosphaeria variabile]